MRTTVSRNNGNKSHLALRRKEKARREAGLSLVALNRGSVLDVQLGAAIARTAFRIVRTIFVGVRRDRTALAVANRTDQACCIDAVARQVVVDGLGATLGELLVVFVGTDGVGVAGDF